MTVGTKGRWYIQLGLGTLMPAVSGLILMLYGKFEMPAESWEFVATVCTFIFFLVHHTSEKNLHSSNWLKERILCKIVTLLISISAVSWFYLTFPWFTPRISPALRLELRVCCGLVMFSVIFGMNIYLWNYWKQRLLKNEQSKEDETDDPCNHFVHSRLLLYMVDIPIAISLTIVIVGCIIIMKRLPDETIIRIFKEIPAKWESSAILHARLSIASAFYGGAAAFHMMLGNAVFSFIQSGHLHSVIAAHSKFRSKGNHA